MAGRGDEPLAPPRRPATGVIAASCIGLGLMLALAVWGAVSSWRLAGDVHMSIHGWIAMGIAGVFTALLAGGLISLAFYSARKGYDDDAQV